MKLGFKKWFSILGLLLAIIISLGIGTYFDLSILEGLEGETVTDEEKTPVEEETSTEETPVEEETTPDMTLADTSDSTPSNRKRRGEDVFNNVMNTDAKESFSLIQNF